MSRARCYRLPSRHVGRASRSVGIVPLLTLLVALTGCEGATLSGPVGGPAPPENLSASYYAYAVDLDWELSPDWNGETFLVYGKRESDPDFFLIAEITSCADGFCTYRDLNVIPGAEYEYFVAALDADGVEAASATVGPVEIPDQTAPPVPGDLEAVALDGAIYVRWGAQSLDAEDFSFYRVYLYDQTEDTSFLLGETDSQGFVDLRAENGVTSSYFVAAVDEHGHVSEGSELAEGTPRPDFHGELLYAYQDDPSRSGFRFQDSETPEPILSGDDPNRDFRLEVDQTGWLLVPATGVEVHTEPVFTTALRCGVAADAGCLDIEIAPANGYSSDPIYLAPRFSYVIRVPAGQGSWHYGVLRVTHVGDTQDGAIAIFDWAFQLQAGNRNLAPPKGAS